MPTFVDTNVLVYARDASEPDRQPLARAWLEHLWRTGTGRLSVQVLEEYYVTVTRKLRPGVPAAEARADLEDLMAWRPIAIGADLLRSAWTLEERYDLSFWDALIVAEARAAGCRFLLSEDLTAGASYDGVQVVDPFRTPVGSIEPGLA